MDLEADKEASIPGSLKNITRIKALEEPYVMILV